MMSIAAARRLLIVFLLAACVCLPGCNLTPKPDPLAAATDAERFKLEHENINGTKDSFNATPYRTIHIPEENPILYSSYPELVQKTKNMETFVVYFGFPECPWCRAELEMTLEAALENQVDAIYFVNVRHSRDTYELQEGKPVKTKEPEDGYYELLELLGDALDEYTLSDDNVPVGEKRIYAPTVLLIKEGKIYARKESSGLLTSSSMELTDEIRADIKAKASSFFRLLKKNDS